MKKLILILIILMHGLYASANNKQEQYKNILDHRIKFYPLYYNSLSLSPEQISEFEYIIETYNKKYEQIIFGKNNTKELKKISKQENKDLKQILDRRQKSLFGIIKHLERQDIKRSLKPKDYYKSNPRMSVFGDLPKK